LVPNLIGGPGATGRGRRDALQPEPSLDRALRRGGRPYHHFVAIAAIGIATDRGMQRRDAVSLGRKEASGYQVLVASPANLGIFFLLQRQVVEGLPGP